MDEAAKVIESTPYEEKQRLRKLQRVKKSWLQGDVPWNRKEANRRLAGLELPEPREGVLTYARAYALLQKGDQVSLSLPEIAPYARSFFTYGTAIYTRIEKIENRNRARRHRYRSIQ